MRSALRRTYKALDSDTFRSLTYLLSVFGANSNDPAFRRSSENYLRMRALRELRTQNETLSEIASAQSAARTPVQLEPSSDDVAEASIGLEIVERIAKSGPPSQAEFDQFSYYVRFRGLDGPPGTYCMGAIRAGYLARKAEEDIGPTDPDTPVRALLAELQSGEMANASIRVQRGTASAAFAMHMKWHGFALDVLAIEGPVKGSRDVVRTYALKLLTSPGATFTSVPAGVTTELAESAFDFGYALRCTESGGAGHRPS